MPANKIFYGWWIVVATVFGLMVCNGPILYTMTVFIPPLTEEFGWGRGDVALSLTFHTVANALAMPIVGRLVDRFGAKRVLVPSIIAWGAGIALVSVIPGSLAALYATFFLLGVVTSGATPLPYGRAITAFFNRRRGMALGIAMAGTGLGTLLMPVFAQHLIAGYGWRIAWAGIGAVILTVGLLIVIPLFRDNPEQMGLTPDGEPPEDGVGTTRSDLGLTAKAALHTHQFWLMALVFLILAMATIGTAAHLSPLLIDRGIAAKTAAIGSSIMGVALLFGRIWAGYLMDRYFAPFVAIGFTLGPVIGCLLFVSGADGTLAFVAAAGIGMGIGAEMDMMAYFISRYFGLRSFGVLYGYLFGVFLIGGGIGPPLMGYGYDANGSYTLILCLFALLCLGACVALAMLGPYREFSPESVSATTPSSTA